VKGKEVQCGKALLGSSQIWIGSAFMPAIHVHIVAASDADCTQALNLVDNIIQCGAFNSVWRLTPVIK